MSASGSGLRAADRFGHPPNLLATST